MSNLLPILVLIACGIALTLLLRRGVLTQRRGNLIELAHQGTVQESGIASEVLRKMRSRNLSALAVALAGGVLALYLNDAFPQASGLPLVVVPAGAWVLVALVFVCWPIPYEFQRAHEAPGSRISADLTPRSTRMFGPVWGIVVPGVLLAATILGLIIAGLASSPDERGLFRMLPYSSSSGAQLDENLTVTAATLGEGSTGPFPGWYYGVPLLFLLILGAVLTLWALNINVRRPALRSPALREFDNTVRMHNGYLLSTGFTSVLCFQLLPPIMMASLAIYNAGYKTIFTVGENYADGNFPEAVTDPWNAALSFTMGALGVLLLLAGVVLLGQLAGWIGASVKAADAKVEKKEAR